MTDRPNVLFVDDDPNILHGLRRSLRGKTREWEMHFAAGGREGLGVIESRPVDVVVTDMRMPEMDGAQFMAEVMAKSPETIRFVLSGQSDDESIMRSIGLCHQYLAKPCETAVLSAKIDNALTLRKRMRNERLRSLMTSRLKVPSNAARYQKLVAELQSSRAHTETIAASIEVDPGLAALVLQIANSAFFGPARRISSIAQAVTFLGSDIIRALVLKRDFLQLTMPDAMPDKLAQDIFRHCEDSAAIARLLARRESMSPATADDCFAAGLFHDLGRFLLASADPASFARNKLAEASDIELPWLERNAFGVTHSEAAGYVLGLWGLPNPIVEAVVFHHEPDFALRAEGEPAFFVFIANWILGRLHPVSGQQQESDVEMIADLTDLIGDERRAAGIIEAVETSGLAVVEA